MTARKVVARPPMLEEDLMAAVKGIAQLKGWKYYHTYDSRKSDRGFPDVVLVHGKARKVLWRELKRDDNKPTPGQQEWLDELTAAGEDARVWKPADLVSGRILRELTT